MAERGAKKSRPRAPASAAREAPRDTVVSRESLVERVRDLELEREGLKSELAAANARLRALEGRINEAVARVDSALDSLHKIARG
ncbi:MAG TPA: hypothetical protein PK264_20725 [Hyphomicrobiaceae bacterium]|nr:hypothetical protein [Hyphomicrobiaceae bacterium]